MKIAIPTDAPGGTKSRRSAHFGHCDIFTVIEISQGNEISQVETIVNEGHGPGGCMSPIQLLKQEGVEAIVVSGLGKKPLQGFVNAGITVLYADSAAAPDVESVLHKLVTSDLVVMHPDQACRGSADCQH